MNVKKLLLAAVAVGVVMNIVDFVVHGLLLTGYYSQFPFFRKEMPMQWFVIGDFVAALVFVWVYDRVFSSFGGGPKGGATFGLYACSSTSRRGSSRTSSSTASLTGWPGCGRRSGSSGR